MVFYNKEHDISNCKLVGTMRGHEHGTEKYSNRSNTLENVFVRSVDLTKNQNEIMSIFLYYTISDRQREERTLLKLNGSLLIMFEICRDTYVHCTNSARMDIEHDILFLTDQCCWLLDTGKCTNTLFTEHILLLTSLRSILLY